MSATHLLPQPPPSDPLPRKRFTRQEVERMAEAGFFDGQRYELIDGDLIDKMGQKPPHASGIRRITAWLFRFLDSRLVQVQLPVEAAPEERSASLPEPDVAVLAEMKPDYERRHPHGDELLLVVEVADSSAAFDLTRKAALYARAGVREYWVLDLNRRMLVVHRQGDGVQYRDLHMYSEDDLVSMEGRAERVAVRDLLPETAA